MEFSTTTFTTKGGHTLEMLAFVTGRQIEGAMLAQTGDEMPGIAGKLQAAHRTLELIVLSVDGHKQGEVVEGSDKPFSVVEAILDMPVADYVQISEKVGEIADGGPKDVPSTQTA